MQLCCFRMRARTAASLAASFCSSFCFFLKSSQDTRSCVSAAMRAACHSGLWKVASTMPSPCHTTMLLAGSRKLHQLPPASMSSSSPSRCSHWALQTLVTKDDCTCRRSICTHTSHRQVTGWTADWYNAQWSTWSRGGASSAFPPPCLACCAALCCWFFPMAAAGRPRAAASGRSFSCHRQGLIAQLPRSQQRLLERTITAAPVWTKELPLSYMHKLTAVPALHPFCQDLEIHLRTA